MTFWSGIEMGFGTGILTQFTVPPGTGNIQQCITGTVAVGFTVPSPCTWWEIFDQNTGLLTGYEFHVDTYNPTLRTFHIDQVMPGPLPVNPAKPVIAEMKIDSLESCDYFKVHWPAGYTPGACSWWEVISPPELAGYEFHVDGSSSGEFHIDEVRPGPIIFPPPWVYEIVAIQKIQHISPCDEFVVEDPPDWWPNKCTWWEILDPFSDQPTGYEFHVDWTNESCEFHIDEVYPGPVVFPIPGVPYVTVEQKITSIVACDSFVVVNPSAFNPSSCSWWEILDPATGASTGLEFHVDKSANGIFHVDQTNPSPITIPWGPPPSYTIKARQKIDVVQQCSWLSVDDPANTPETCSWWKIISPSAVGNPDIEFHVDTFYSKNGTFHVDYVNPVGLFNPPVYEIVAERKIEHVSACDTFMVINPMGYVPGVCSWWKIVLPTQWAGVKFHVDWNDGMSKFHIDVADQLPPGPAIPPWNVTAVLIQPPSGPWYVKPAYPDYAPSGMPDFDEHQDQWGPGQGTYTWCGPVAVANSLWWLDSEYESIMFPNAVPPPTPSDHFNLVATYGQWDDHDIQNVDPFVRNLAWLMDTDGQQTHDGHTGTRWQDMEKGIKQYIIQQGLAGLFEVHNASYPKFAWIESEIEKCQDVVLFLEFWSWTGSTWQPLYDNPSLESGHFVTCAGVNSTSLELLISDPYWDAFESLINPKGRSPVPHVYPHPTPLHNDAQFVSQDAYQAANYTGPPPSPYGEPVWELLNYLQYLGYGQSWHAFIRAAVVTSPLGVHDVAVTKITPIRTVVADNCSRPEHQNPPIHNYNVRVCNVTVENQGDFPETFNVTLYASNITDLVIGKQLVSLGSHTNTTLTFLWNTKGVAKKFYTLKAVADTVTGEVDTLDNTLINGKVRVVLPGNANGDKIVNMVDIYTEGILRFMKTEGQSGYTYNADMNDDKIVNWQDIYIAILHFMQTEP